MTDNRGPAWRPAPDDAAIATLDGSFSRLSMDRGIEGITRRARTLSRRRRARPAVATVALAAAAGAVVVVSRAQSPAPAAAVAAPGPGAGSIALTGFAVKDDPANGVVTVTVKNFSDPSGLITALARYGIKVQLTYMKIPSPQLVRRAAGMMGTSGGTYYFGPGWVRQPDGTYQIRISVKALGADRVQPIVVVTGYTPSAG